MPNETKYYSTEKYKIQPGDTLTSIAKKYNTNVKGLLHLNPNISDPNIIFADDFINVPRTNPLIFVEVKSGDTLYSILRHYNLRLAQEGINDKFDLGCLLTYNPNIENPDIIYPGMKIYLPEIL